MPQLVHVEGRPQLQRRHQLHPTAQQHAKLVLLAVDADRRQPLADQLLGRGRVAYHGDPVVARLLQVAGLDIGARAQPPHPDGARPDRPHPLELLLPLRGARHREEDAARPITGILIGPRPGQQLDVTAQRQATARQQRLQQIHRETTHRLAGQLVVVRGHLLGQRLQCPGRLRQRPRQQQRGQQPPPPRSCSHPRLLPMKTDPCRGRGLT